MSRRSYSDSRGAIALVALCDLGARYGKGAEFQSILRAFESQKNDLEVVGIFRDRKKYRGPFRIMQVLPFGNLFFRVIVLLERLGKMVRVRFPSREVQDWLFDWLAARLLPKNTSVLMTMPGMAKTLARAKKLGATTVLHGVVMHPGYNLDVLGVVFPDGGYPSVWSAGMMGQGVRSMDFFDYVISPSSSSARSYLDKGFHSDRVRVVPLGFDCPVAFQEIKPWSKTDRLRILYVGNITRMKGCDILMEAIGLLDPELFEFHFVGDIQSDMESMSAEAGRRDNVFFHGQRPSSELYPFCHVLVLMSLSEGLARVIIEAGSYGLLVVTNQWVHGDLVIDGQSGIICEQNAVALAQVLEHITAHRLDMSAFRHGLQEKCRHLTRDNFGEGVRLALVELLK